jgi:hypothetical protein
MGRMGVFVVVRLRARMMFMPVLVRMIMRVVLVVMVVLMVVVMLVVVLVMMGMIMVVGMFVVVVVLRGLLVGRQDVDFGGGEATAHDLAHFEMCAHVESGCGLFKQGERDACIDERPEKHVATDA